MTEVLSVIERGARSVPMPARERRTFRPGDRLRVWSSRQWVAYYRANAANLRAVPWDDGAGVTDAERDAVAGSLRAWQLGETSDGSRLRAAARRYAEQTGDPAFLEATNLFIAEEQRHGAELGRFLDLAGVPRAGWDWGDALFRFARYFLPRIEGWATPVVMVETHALLYYAALKRATGSAVLHTVCEQILSDEVPHVRFQCERLADLHRHRPRVLRAVTMGCHRLFFAAITLAVWAAHRRALRAGGYTFRRFWRGVWAGMTTAWKRMDPRAYRWADGG